MQRADPQLQVIPRADPPSAQEHIDAATRAEVQDRLALVQLGHGGRVAAAQAGQHGAVRKLVAVQGRVQLGAEAGLLGRDDVRHSYASAALAADIPAKVVSERLGHASIAITMDTYSHVLPGLDAEAAGTVARLILGDGDQEPARPVDKALTTDRPTPSGREEVKREAPGQRSVRAGGFEPPRVAPPGPKLRMRCGAQYCPGLYQALTLGGRQSVVPILCLFIPGCRGASREQSREHRGSDPIRSRAPSVRYYGRGLRLSGAAGSLACSARLAVRR